MGNMNMSNTGMDNYVRVSLETHLFFARIMKEHALFFLAAFPAVEMEYRKKADLLREELEKALADAVLLADHRVGTEVLNSGEIVTEFTRMAEQQTKGLTGIPIDVRITQAEKELKSGQWNRKDRELSGNHQALPGVQIRGSCRDHRLQDPFGDSAASGGSRAPGGESLSQAAGRRSTERSCRRKMLLMPLRYFQRKKLVVYLM